MNGIWNRHCKKFMAAAVAIVLLLGALIPSPQPAKAGFVMSKVKKATVEHVYSWVLEGLEYVGDETGVETFNNIANFLKSPSAKQSDHIENLCEDILYELRGLSAQVTKMTDDIEHEIAELTVYEKTENLSNKRAAISKIDDKYDKVIQHYNVYVQAAQDYAEGVEKNTSPSTVLVDTARQQLEAAFANCYFEQDISDLAIYTCNYKPTIDGSQGKPTNAMTILKEMKSLSDSAVPFEHQTYANMTNILNEGSAVFMDILRVNRLWIDYQESQGKKTANDNLTFQQTANQVVQALNDMADEAVKTTDKLMRPYDFEVTKPMVYQNPYNYSHHEKGPAFITYDLSATLYANKTKKEMDFYRVRVPGDPNNFYLVQKDYGMNSQNMIYRNTDKPNNYLYYGYMNADFYNSCETADMGWGAGYFKMPRNVYELDPLFNTPQYSKANSIDAYLRNMGGMKKAPANPSFIVMNNWQNAGQQWFSPNFYATYTWFDVKNYSPSKPNDQNEYHGITDDQRKETIAIILKGSDGKYYSMGSSPDVDSGMSLSNMLEMGWGRPGGTKATMGVKLARPNVSFGELVLVDNNNKILETLLTYDEYLALMDINGTVEVPVTMPYQDCRITTTRNLGNPYGEYTLEFTSSKSHDCLTEVWIYNPGTGWMNSSSMRASGNQNIHMQLYGPSPEDDKRLAFDDVYLVDKNNNIIQTLVTEEEFKKNRLPRSDQYFYIMDVYFKMPLQDCKITTKSQLEGNKAQTAPSASSDRGSSGVSESADRGSSGISESAATVIMNFDDLKRAAQAVQNDPETYAGTSFRLGADIDAGGAEWTLPIGTEKHPFTGTFDGDGHSISGLSITGDAGGLFGHIGEGGVVSDLHLYDTDVSAGEGYAGALAAVNGGKLEYCRTGAGHLLTDTEDVPNLDDMNVHVASEGTAGGLAGKNDGEIVNCSTTAVVNGETAGGIAGENTGTIHNSFGSTVTQITGEAYSGGIAGVNSGALKNVYFGGDTEGEKDGAIAGKHEDGTANACYYDQNLDEPAGEGELAAQPVDTSDMKQDSFAAQLNENVEGDAYYWQRRDDANLGLPYTEEEPYYERTLTDEASGVDAAGEIHAAAGLSVTPLAETDEAYRAMAEEKEGLAGAYDIKLNLPDGVSGKAFEGALDLAFLGTGADTVTVAVLHGKGGEYVSYAAQKGEDGKYHVTVDELSVFGVVADTPATGTMPAEDGDSGAGQNQIWLILGIVLAGAGAAALVIWLYLRRKRAVRQ